MSEAPPSSFLARNEFLIRRLHSLSGMIPVGAYMVVHLLTNATVLDSPAKFQAQVNTIHGLGLVLPVVEPHEALRFERATQAHALWQPSSECGEVGRANVARRRSDGGIPLALQRLLGTSPPLLPLTETARHGGQEHAATNGHQHARPHGPVTPIANKMTMNPLPARS